jgi:hypothetical protein
MEPDVAERAAARCEQQINEVESILEGLVTSVRRGRSGTTPTATPPPLH